MATDLPATGTQLRSAPRQGADPVADGPQMLSRPSPNFTVRRDGLRPELVVLHYTAMHSAAAALERLCDPQAEVSAHYLIAETGEVWQLVDEEMRAWHAGAGTWRGQEDINSRSIGIELANCGDHPFGEPQMAALETLLTGILKRHDIPAEGVIGHSDMAPGRKSDPGARFDWRRLALQGLSVWPDEGEDSAHKHGVWKDHAEAFGYDFVGADQNSDAEALVFKAFRARFRPWAHGPRDGEDLRIIKRLCTSSKL